MKVGIIGTGAYGLSLGIIFQENNCQVTMWTKFQEEKEQLDQERRDDKKLPNITIPEEIIFTTNLQEAIQEKDLIMIVIPATFVDQVAQEMAPFIDQDQVVCIASKGIENNTCSFLTEVVSRHMNVEHLAVISGPSFAIDVANRVPIGLSLAVQDKKTEQVLRFALENDHFKLRTTDDVVGIEICGAIKNVIALAAGMLDGMQVTDSTRAMFITETLHDIKQLIDALGGDKKTILSFAGFGDLLLTCTSMKSRNFCYGKLIGEGKSEEELADYRKNHTIEGLYTLKSIHQLICNERIDIPIITLIYRIIFHQEDCQKLLNLLITKE